MDQEVNKPKCPYRKSKHEEDSSNPMDIFKIDMKVLFSGHEVMGQGWICEECGNTFFIVKSFNEKKIIKRKTKGTKI